MSTKEVLSMAFRTMISERSQSKWREALESASTSFLHATTAWWQQIFIAISHLDESRGALPEVALRLFISVADEDELQELLSATKQELHSTSLTNAEALRKLVKKFDKEHCDNTERLSPMLLPQVYSANFVIGQSTLEAALVHSTAADTVVAHGR